MPKIVYTDKLDDIVNEYSNTYHRTIKMKPIHVKDNTHIDSIKDVDNEDPKFQVGPHVRISKYKNIFAKGYTPYWSEEVFVISKIKKTVPRTYVIINNWKNIIKPLPKKVLIPLGLTTAASAADARIHRKH